jgi:hypothetical protein
VRATEAYQSPEQRRQIQEGIPESHKYMVTMTTAITAVAAIASATPSDERSGLCCSDMVISLGVSHQAAHYNSIGTNPKVQYARALQRLRVVKT